MSMSKKDFVALADAVREAELSLWQKNVIADKLAQSNPRFMRKRWLRYINGKCGPNGGEVKKARKFTEKDEELLHRNGILR